MNAKTLSEDVALLTLPHWLSPACPLGSFAYSHGLETAIALGDVRSAEDLEHWPGHILRFGSGQADAILLHAALRGEGADRLAAVARALAPSAEGARETEEQRAASARTVSALAGQPAPARPVALGVVARGLGFAPERVLALFPHAFLSNLMSCAARAISLGQTEAQAVLARLAAPLSEVAHRTAQVPTERIASAAFGADPASLAHETLPVRIYRT